MVAGHLLWLPNQLPPGSLHCVLVQWEHLIESDKNAEATVCKAFLWERFDLYNLHLGFPTFLLEKVALNEHF